MNQLKIDCDQLQLINRYSSIHTTKYVNTTVYDRTNSDNPWYFYSSTADTVSLSKKYNVFAFYSFIIQYDTYIDTELNVDNALSHNINLFLNAMSSVFLPQHKYLAVVEHGPIKGFHINYIIITPSPLTTDEITMFKSALTTYIQYNIKDIDLQCEVIPIIKQQKIKSQASWLNYLKKSPWAMLSGDIEILNMFSNFNKNHIFPVDSISGRYKRAADGSHIYSNNDMVSFFLYCFDQDILDLSEIYKVPEASKYFHATNFEKTYKNCYNSFLAKRTLTDELLYIMTQFWDLDSSKKCFCPIRDWLEFQELDFNSFDKKVTYWLYALIKRNVLFLIGPGDCGKSHFARLLWSCFLSHKVILPDGLYSFANLQNAGCGLWEEPIILPEFVDMTKLIFEGEPSVEVAVKHSPSLKLGKRVPLIVTTNSEVSTYCSSSHDILEARFFRITVNKRVVNDQFCEANNGEHYCPKLTDHTHVDFDPDAASSSNNATSDNPSEQTERGWYAEGAQEAIHERRPVEGHPHVPSYACDGLHLTYKNHMLSYLTYLIVWGFYKYPVEIKKSKCVDFNRIEEFINRHKYRLSISGCNYCHNSIIRPDL